MRNVTPAWLTAAQHDATQRAASAAYEPVVLVDFVTLERFFATRHHTTSARTYEYDVARLGEGGLQPLRLDLDEMSNAVRLSGMTLRLLNIEQLWTTFTGLLDNTRVQVWLTFAGLTDADALPLFPGVVDRHAWSRSALDVTLIDASFRLHRNLSVAIGGQYFPSAPLASRRQFIPIVLGVAVDAPTIQVSGDAQGTLAFGIGGTAPELLMVEIGAPFPTSGTVSIGDETGVTYATRDLVLVSGVTYLRLGGMVRAGTVSHPAETVVTLTSASFIYLIGYRVSSLQAVRDEGILVNPFDYALEQMDADRPVSVLVFTTQRGRITVDVNGPNVDLSERLVNGSFETGDATGWTLGAGSVLVGSAAPFPLVGQYRAALTGPAVNALGTLFQDVATIPNATYLARLHYRNAQTTSLLVNGGFESGDLSGWTSVQARAGTRYGVVRAFSPPGEYAAVFGNALLYQGAAAEGTMFLQMAGGVHPQGAEFVSQLDIAQDVPAVSGATYLFQAFALSGMFLSPHLAPTSPLSPSTSGVSRAAGSSVALPIPGVLAVQASYFLGTPASPAQYGTGSLLTPGTTDSAWVQSAAVSFTAQATTIRVTVRLFSVFQNFTPVPVCVDGLHLEQTSLLQTSSASLALGTPADPAFYSAQTLGPMTAWTPVQTSFRVSEEVARLTLRSQYNASALPSYFDQVSVRLGSSPTGLGGQNPVDAMCYVLDTFLPEAEYDHDNFAAAAQQLMGWLFGAVLTNPGDSLSLLQRMAYQCGSLLFQDGAGVFKIVVLHGSPVVEVGFDVTNIVEHACAVSFEPMDNVYSDFYVWFAAKTGGSTSSSDFQGVVYATPTATTAASTPGLATQCSAALALYGREHRLDYYADFIQDVGTAHLLLIWLVSRLTIRHTVCTFRTWLDGIRPEMGDRVQLTHPLLTPQDEAVICETIGQHVDFASMQVELVVRTLTLGGWHASFEYNVRVLEDSGWQATFGFDVLPDDGEGWSADFED